MESFTWNMKMQLKNTMAGFPRFYNAFSSIALQQGYKFKSADESMDVYENDKGSLLNLDESKIEISFGENKITKSNPKAALAFISAMNQMTAESVPMLFMSHEDDGATGASLSPATPNLNPEGPAVPQYDNAYSKLMSQYGYNHAGASNGGDLYTKSGMPDVEVGQDHVRFTDVKSMGVKHDMPDTYNDIASFTTALNEIGGGTTGTQTEVSAGPTNPDGVNTVKSEAPQVQAAGATSSNMKGESLEPRFKNRFSIVLESYGYELSGRMGKADLYSKEGSELSFKVTKEAVSAIVPQSESEMKVQAFETGSKLMAYLESHPETQVSEDAADGDAAGSDPAKKNQEVQAEQPEKPGAQVDGAPAGMDQQTTPSDNVHQNVNGMEVQTTGGQQQMHQTPVNTENDPNHPVQSGQAVASPSPNGNVKATESLTADPSKFYIIHKSTGKAYDGPFEKEEHAHMNHNNMMDASYFKVGTGSEVKGFDKDFMPNESAGDAPPFVKKDEPTDKDGDEVKIKVANADDALAKLKKAGVSADKCSDTCVQVDPKDEDKARKALNESFADMNDVERFRSLTESYESKIEKFDSRNASESHNSKAEKVSTLRRLTGLLK